MGNSNLHAAQKVKNDEFYTMLADIEKELYHYHKQFENKVVYCNCDNIQESNFFKYFSLNFEFLNLKKLIISSYNNNGQGVLGVYDNKQLHISNLQGNGDFRSDECLKILQEVDIVVTNPPFSLFREYISILMQYNKKFLIIGNQNAINDKIVFKYIMSKQIWIGHNYVKEFIQPNGEVKKFGNICWFTNMETNKQVNPILIIKTYNENDYLKYDNYNAINVDKIKDIPYDYDSAMGVPITVINKVCSDGFIHFDCPNLKQRDVKYKIIGVMADKRDKDEIFIKGIPTYVDENHKNYVGPILKKKMVYTRILIQKVK